MKSLPNFSEEKKLWKKDYRVVIGVDEVGRGAFAGPVTAAAVCFCPSVRSGIGHDSIADRRRLSLELYLKEIGVNDSKVLRPKKREELAREIKRLALVYTVASASVGEINRMGIGKATARAFRRAVAKCKVRFPNKERKLAPQSGASSAKRKAKAQSLKLNENVFILSDAVHIKYLKGIGLKNQKAIKKGDKKSLSIAAASILAKVNRDRLMRKFSRCHRYRKYAWKKNKGYGTWEHRKAILRYGLTRLHRKRFVWNSLREIKRSQLTQDRQISSDPGSA